MGKFARNILDGRWDDPFTTGWLGHPTLWFYASSRSRSRRSATESSALRLLTALIGAATVAALYIFARRWYGPRVALMASALLAAYHFHVHFSRIGAQQRHRPVLRARGLSGSRSLGGSARSPLLLAAAGVSVGVAQNFYFGARLEALVLLVVLAHQLIVSRAAVVAVGALSCP